MCFDSLSDDDIADIKQRTEMASPGPWIHASEGIIETENPHRRIIALVCKGSNRIATPLPATENAAFISNARTDILRLIAEVEQLRALLYGRVNNH